MHKYLLAIFSVVLLVTSFGVFKKEVVSQFSETCFEFDGGIDCGFSTIAFNGEYAYEINKEFYSDIVAFWIFDTVNSSDCSRIEKAIAVTEDKPLVDYFKINLNICNYEVSEGLRKDKLYINSKLYNEYEWYEQFFEDNVEFVSAKQEA